MWNRRLNAIDDSDPIADRATAGSIADSARRTASAILAGRASR